MALQIVEYQYLATDARGNVIAAGEEPALAAQQVNMADTSDAFHGGCRFLRLHAEEACRVAFGENPTATAASPFKMSAGQTEFPGVKPGHKLHVVTA